MQLFLCRLQEFLSGTNFSAGLLEVCRESGQALGDLGRLCRRVSALPAQLAQIALPGKHSRKGTSGGGYVGQGANRRRGQAREGGRL